MPAMADARTAGTVSVPLDQTGVNIASNVKAPGYNGTALSSTSYNSQNLESFHYNESGLALSSVSLIYSGWYTNNVSEADSPNPFMVTASIEYPYGTFTQVTWNGTAQLTDAPGANIVSDRATVAIPAGAQFWVRTFISVPVAGYQWPTTYSSASGELCEMGTGLADKTMGGTITNNGSVARLRPSAILSKVSLKVSQVCMGDSIMAGAGDGGMDSHGNIGWCNKAASGLAPNIGIAVTGTKLADQAATGKFLRRADLIAKAGITHVIVDWSVNDLPFSSLSAMETQEASIATALSTAGAKVVWTTLTPQSTSLVGWRTPAQASGSYNALRVSFNNYIRGTPSPLYGYLENAYATEAAHDTSIWATGNQNTYLGAQETLTALSGSTTAVVKTASVKATGYYNGGSLVITGGTLAETTVNITSSDASGNLTLASTLASAPSAGDAVSIYPYTSSPTSDGTHPNTWGALGGQAILLNNYQPQISYWLTH